MEFKKGDLIKSPLNYTGGKFKLLPQILPLFPDNIDTFVDLFAGGFKCKFKCQLPTTLKGSGFLPQVL